MRTDRRPIRTQHGFSIVEALIAAAILLIIAIGILPLFTRAMVNNVSGNDSTLVSNFGRSDVEELVQLPFDNALFTIPTTANKSVFPTEYRLEGAENVTGDEEWSTTAPGAGEISFWTRTTTVRQYAVNALDDHLLTADEALDGDADPARVHLRGIEVEVASRRDPTGPLGKGKQITLRTLKSQ